MEHMYKTKHVQKTLSLNSESSLEYVLYRNKIYIHSLSHAAAVYSLETNYKHTAKTIHIIVMKEMAHCTYL